MKTLKIQHNMAIEFVLAVARYGLDHKIKEELKDASFSFEYNKDIIAWIAMIDQNISPFMKTDIDLVVKNFEMRNGTDLDLIVENKIKTPRAYIDYLKKTDGNYYIKRCFENYDLQALGFDVTLDSSNEEVMKAISNKKGETEAKLFIQFKEYPEEFMYKVINLYEQFYEKFFKPYEKEIEKFMMEKIYEHNKKLQANQREFFKNILLGDYTSLLKDDVDLDIYITYIMEFGISIGVYEDERTSFIIYGYGFEQSMDEKVLREKYKEMFKALADDKRYEILKLIGKRKWYSNELAKHFGLTSATMSYHINKLIGIGIVNFETGDQNKLYYKVDREQLKELMDFAVQDILSK